MLRGRDAIFLDTFDFDVQGVLKLAGEINGDLTSKSTDKFLRYSLTFFDVMAFKVVELDSWDYQSSSSFDEIVDSEWCRTLGGKITPNHKHFQIQTYDDVIDVVASRFSLSIVESTSK